MTVASSNLALGMIKQRSGVKTNKIFENKKQRQIGFYPLLKHIKMDERRFTTQGSDQISCDQPCEQEFAREVPAGKSIKVPTFRCVAPGSPLRGQHFGGTETRVNPAVCRACTIYQVSSSETGGDQAASVDSEQGEV